MYQLGGRGNCGWSDRLTAQFSGNICVPVGRSAGLPAKLFSNLLALMLQLPNFRYFIGRPLVLRFPRAGWNTVQKHCNN